MSRPIGPAERDRPRDVVDAGGAPRWGSDLIVDLLRLLDIEYAAVMPGSTFRGIHDSAVNYLGNQRPELILTNHEMVTVAMARGYARVTGRPMAAIVHNLVGLLNAGMSIFDGWSDRVPILLLGGAGPLDSTHRRPWIDWIHASNSQGALFRDFTKWDDQPASLAAIPEAVFRANRIARTEPAGPVYLAFDLDLQEQEIVSPVTIPDKNRYLPARPAAPDSGGLAELAKRLVSASLPVVLADRFGRSAAAVAGLVELAELLAVPVIDLGARANFPTPHPLEFAGNAPDLLKEADLVLALDVGDLAGTFRAAIGTVPDSWVAHISLDELLHRGFVADYQALPAVDLPLLGDSGTGVLALVELCRRGLDNPRKEQIERRRKQLADRQTSRRERQRQQIAAVWDTPGIAEARLIGELWDAVKDQDYVLTQGRIRRMGPGIFRLSGPDQDVTGGGGGAVGAGPGVALGAALAHRYSGKLPVAVLGDGETLSALPALWTAAHYRLPSLWIVNNNRSYFNDEDHQDRIARRRGRPVENRNIAMRMEDPEVDFAAAARSFGLHGEGPISHASDLGPALRRAVAATARGQMAIVDVRTTNRSNA